MHRNGGCHPNHNLTAYTEAVVMPESVWTVPGNNTYENILEHGINHQQ